jgi:hypothetical protein
MLPLAERPRAGRLPFKSQLKLYLATVPTSKQIMVLLAI